MMSVIFLQVDFEIFLGRFHPLIVHLPIGFILLAAILQGLNHFFKDKFDNLDNAISIAILCGGFGAVASAIIGYLLAGSGGYDDQTLFWHQWLGILLSILCFFGWAVKVGHIRFQKLSTSMTIILLVGLVSITGHLGGNLTHGSDYLLVYAPKFVKKMAGLDETGHKMGTPIPTHRDSIVVYKHLVQPFLMNKCQSCHSEPKAKGQLAIGTWEGLIKGGENGEVIIPGKSQESSLFLRTTLPQKSKKFMPPKGEPLTYSELKILEWWIDNGASFDAPISDSEISKEMQSLLLRDYDIDTQPKPYYETIQVPLLPEVDLNKMIVSGLKVEQLAEGHHFLQVEIDSAAVSIGQIQNLLVAKEQITWLDLAGKSVENEMLEIIGQLPNLTILNLNGNPINDEGISGLQGLNHLEVLNLYDTQITDRSIAVLSKMTSLIGLYLWKTDMTEKGIEELKTELPNTTIDFGVQEASE
jgi:uncharacterized membrane protein